MTTNRTTGFGAASSSGCHDDDRIRVFVVESEEIVRAGLRVTVGAEPDLEIVGEAATTTDAQARLPLADADIVLVDLDLPDACGTQVCEFVRSHLDRTRVLVLSASPDDAAVAHAVRSGADAYMMRRAPIADIVWGIRRLATGKRLTDHLRRERIEALAECPDTDERLARLTHQERALLEHLAEGLTNQEIARAMGLSDKTVKNYVSSVMMKLEVAHRAAAAAYFARTEAKKPCSAHANAMSDSVILY